MTGRQAAMTTVDVRTRAGHARSFLSAAELLEEFRNETDVGLGGNVVGSLAVLAGIAASDAICGHALRVRAAGENHGEAVALLAQSTLNGKAYSKHLARLLEGKSNAHYSPQVMTTARAAELVKSARRLCDGMDVELGR